MGMHVGTLVVKGGRGQGPPARDSRPKAKGLEKRTRKTDKEGDAEKTRDGKRS